MKKIIALLMAMALLPSFTAFAEDSRVIQSELFVSPSASIDGDGT